ncbi:putative GTPase-activator protein [Zalerion maritima]|uniref:GTPase-activator protein n=1 Tax=Zalerion maritima TaxID=339359 RepID=A0AAD5RTE6_9PEZI|nr:putative GTPase-activator protein [Zalerion maritima]
MRSSPEMMSILPPGMDGGTQNGQRTGGRSDWAQNAADTLTRTMERSREKVSNSNLRNTFRANVNLQNTIRAVTPELPLETAQPAVNQPTPQSHTQSTGNTATKRPPVSMNNNSNNALSGPIFASPATATSPRLIPVGTGDDAQRRQGVVFNNSFDSVSYESGPSSSPPPRPANFRPRTYTMDGALRQQAPTAPLVDIRSRIGSFSSPGAHSIVEEPRLLGPTIDSLSVPSVAPHRPSAPPPSLSSKDKKSSTRRLTKRGSRPTSPLVSPPPSVDSLPTPVPTKDANKILLLMRTLCGRMRGEIEYQSEVGGHWYQGIGYIEEEKGSLMFDPGHNGPFHIAIIPDLRGCRVQPKENAEKKKRCLEISNPFHALELILRPLATEEIDLWLAALLCWQQLRASNNNNAKLSTPAARSVGPGRPDLNRRGSYGGTRDAKIIKAGKVLLWDKGIATSPRTIVKRPSTRDLRSSSTSWRRVSCILQDNGEFKLMTENDVSVLSVIELSQLNRCAIQQLDKSVLEEDFCIAIFPIYASSASQLSVFRPVYIALDTRVLFEVWFVLLRAFTVPDLFAIDTANPDQVVEISDLQAHSSGEVFRLEKHINIRVTEAKIRTAALSHNSNPQQSRHFKDRADNDPLVGNYLAEVILDGEVRSRTTIKSDTKSPFWREDCDFMDLPTSLPYLSVVLKRVDGNLESFSHQLQASLGLPKTGNLNEVLCGAVDIPLEKMDQGKDHEQWLQIMDDGGQAMGSMLVKVHHEELVVLLAKEYQPLSEIMHRFTTGLTLNIAEAMPSNTKRLSELFLNIFQVSGRASEWLMALVEDEIDGIGNQATMKKYRFSRRLKSNDSIESSTSDREQMVRDMGKSLTGEANLLFRGNSLLTQSLEFHMRRLGKDYLEDILYDKIFEINEINPDCEVNPARLVEGDDLQQHWAQLIQLTGEIWDCIKISATKLPPELRHILKYIRAVAEDRYGDFLRTVTYTSVSGFLFLRFICPAILNPKLFGLLRDLPRDRAQRTLTLIAKGLQGLSNLASIGKKEPWMESMNRFLAGRRQEFKEFIDQVCSIPAERSTVTLPASYSTPITILGRLSPMAREGFPSLPYLVDHARNFATLAKLWMEYHPAGGAEARMMDGELRKFHDICADLNKRAGDCMMRVENLRSAENASQPATESENPTTPRDGSLGHGLGLGFMDTHSASSLVGDALAQYPSAVSSGGVSSSTLYNNADKPPGSSGSEFDLEGDPSDKLVMRLARDANSRKTSGGSEGSSSTAGNTLRALRNGRKSAGQRLIPSFIRKGKPDASSPTALLTKVKPEPPSQPDSSPESSPMTTRPPRDRDIRGCEEEASREPRSERMESDRGKSGFFSDPFHGHGHHVHLPHSRQHAHSKPTQDDLPRTTP